MNCQNSTSRRKKNHLLKSFSWKKSFSLSKFLQHKQKFPSDEKLCDVNTSDYSSCSCSSDSSLGCNTIRSESVCSDRDRLSDVDLNFDSDNDLDSSEEIKRDTRRTRMLKHKNVIVIIPEHNISGYTRDEFYLEFIEDPLFIPPKSYFTDHISEIVSVEPHGARFFRENPALIYLPVRGKISSKDKIICLCSNTSRETIPQWEQIPEENFSFKSGRVIIKAHHFSLFTIVVQRPFPEVHVGITRLGGMLQVDDVPGVEVNIPPGALRESITVVVRVLYDNEPRNQYSLHTDETSALASPVIMVGPHGCQFNSLFDPVTVRLPIPDYHKIKRRFGKQAKLTVWRSATSENEPLYWEKLDVDTVIDYHHDGCVTISFPVDHFSFFKVLWDVLTTSLYEAKLGVAYFYPYISFSMMCQAWMEENKDNQSFGLEVICYRSDKKLPEATNYKHKVGSSLKPKLVRPGCITIRLKSELFEANVDAGEDVSLLKTEPDFRGREFEKQFACRFRQEKPSVERGTFGKVIVERKPKEGPNEPLFEFNLHKTGLENETFPPDSTDRWSVVAIKELAGTLHITEDNNWKKFARHIGFTKNEIQTKLAYSADPFLAMVNLYQTRGGTPEEFVQSLYEVSRTIRMQIASGRSESGSPGGSSSGASTSRKWLWKFSPTKWREKDDSDTSATETSISSRKRSNPSGSSGHSSKKRRRRFSDVSETMSSSEESLGTEENRKNESKLNDTDMWNISSLMNTMNWRALGRTLGLEESVLLNIEHAYKATGFRECAYQMLLEWKGRQPQKCTFGTLYTSLCKENMNGIAKQLSVMKLGSIQE